MSFTFFGPNHIKSTGAFSTYLHTGVTWTAPSGYTYPSLLDRDRNNQFSVSLGASGDSITAIDIDLSDSKPVADMLAIQNITPATLNAILLIWVNSTTVDPTNRDDTTASMFYGDFTGNFIMRFPTQTVSTITIAYYGGISYGQIILGTERLELPKNPVFTDYKPNINNVNKEYRMSDGGVINYKTVDKFMGQVGLKFVPESTTTELISMYQTNGSYNFCPYPTSTSWDGDIFNCIWSGKYDFKMPSYDNREIPYYNGKILLKETPA